jgi:large subunit ribosomal protein L17
MKHRVVGRKLGRTSAHRLALLRNLSTSLFEKERITTTLMKAKELRPFAERLLTLSKRETLHARRQVLRHIREKEVVSKMFDTLSARYAQRPGGYTRIVKLGPRRGDSAEMAIIELVGYEPQQRQKDKDKDKDAAPAKGRGGRDKAGEATATEQAEKPKRGKAAAESRPERGKRAKPTEKAKEKAAGESGRKSVGRKGGQRGQ